MRAALRFVKEGLGFAKTARIVGVSWEADQITVVDVDQSGMKPLVRNFAAVPLRGSDEEAGRLLRQWIEENHVTSDLTVAAFPQRLAVVKYVSLPSTDPLEIRDMAFLQACRLTPFSPEEIIADYELLETDPDGYSRVMLVVLRKEDVERYLKVMRAAGLSPDRVILSTQALAPLVTGRYPHKEGTLLAVDVDRTSLNFTGMKGTKFLFGRGVSWEGKGTGPSKTWLVDQIALSLQSWRENNGPLHVSKIVLTGVKRDFVQQPLKEFPCPTEVRDISENAAFERQQPLEGGEASLSVAVGAALANGLARANLLPTEEKQRQGLRQRKRQVLTMAALLGVLLLSLGGIAAQKIHAEKRYLADLERQWDSLMAQAGGMEEILQGLEGSGGTGGQEGALIQVLSALNHAAPSRVSLRSLSFERGQRLALQGETRTLSEVTALIKALKEGFLFADVELRSSQAQIKEGQEVIRFEIEGQFRSKRGETGS